MSTPATIAAAYIELWNEADDTRRMAMLDRHWAADASYVDPMMSVRGHEEVAAMIRGVRSQFAGHRFRLRGTPDGYGARVRFSWSLALPEAPESVQGSDIVRLNQDGRIAEVIGFLDRAPR